MHGRSLAMASTDVVLGLRVRSMRRCGSADRLINDEANRPILTQSVAGLKKLYDAEVLADGLATGTLPVDIGPQIVGDIASVEQVVGDVSQLFARELGRLDALNDDRRARVVGVDVAEPQGGGDVGDDQFQRRLLALADTLLHEVLDVAAAPDPLAIFFLPVCTSAVLGIDVALLEDMVEDVFQVAQLVSLNIEVKELSGDGLIDAGRLVIGEPDLVVFAGHVEFCNECLGRR